MTTRVPFALVGVVLLVGSATLVGSLQEPSVGEPDVERAMDRLDAQTQSALRDATTTAARNAARDPVTVPASTAYGTVLNSSRPFRDSLRVRIYLRVRDALDRISERRHGVDVHASVPAVDGPADLRAAKRRVAVARAGANGTSLRVRIENVTLTASRSGRVLGTQTVSPTLVVPTPTLAVHDRVQRYERRLDADPVDPGLGRRLTARLYPIVWARGYAQYSGAPIENVLANRHVALFTNAALLSLQRDVFDHSDPAGRHVLNRATAHAGLTDLLAGTDFPVADYLLEIHEGVGLSPTPPEALDSAGTVDPAVRPDERVSVAVNGTADSAFLNTYRKFEEILRRTYSARARLTQRVRHLGTRQVQPVESPGPEWGHRRSSTQTTVTVRGRDTDAPPTPSATGRHVLGVHGRTVVFDHTTTHYWSGPERATRLTESREIERVAVTLTLYGNHTLGPAPTRPITAVHARGGPLDGPNLVDIRRKANERLVTNRGGLDLLAERAAVGDDVSETAIINGKRPDRLDEWVYTDLVELRERVRNISITTTRGNLATYRANPPAALASKLRQRRTDLVGVPGTYPSVAQRARIAARTAYLDALLGILEQRARTRNRSESVLREQLAAGSNRTTTETPLERLQTAYDRREAHSTAGMPGGLRMQVDAEPAYLTRSAVGDRRVPAIEHGTEEHPLVARNWNAVTVPYGEVADTVVAAILGPDTTRLRTGAQVLRSVERTDPPTVDIDSESLEREVRTGIRAGREAARSTLAGFDLGNLRTRRKTVRTATSRWDTTGARALAVANGSVASAVHEAAVERWRGQLTEQSRDLLALRLQREIDRATASNRARPTEPTVNRTTGRFREALRDRIASRIDTAVANASRGAVEDAVGGSLARLPAGMPVTPAPGFWYATINLWRVEVAGQYVRFSVRVPRGTPDVPGGQLHYVRDAGTVRLDVDGDGRDELLGRSTRLSFRTGTGVAIAVPPGPQGVGDVDGRPVEESGGWPDPGPTGAAK